MLIYYDDDDDDERDKYILNVPVYVYLLISTNKYTYS